MFPIRSPLLPLAVAATLAVPGWAAAIETEQERKDREKPPVAPRHEDSWFDAGHAYLERQLFAPVIWFDRFFSDERELEAERSRSFMRFRSQVRFRTTGDPVPALSLRANLRVPGLNRWLERARIVITGDSDENLSRLFNEPPQAGEDTIGQANAELRYGLWRGLLSRVDLGAGVLLEVPPGVFTQARLRGSLPLRGSFLLRGAETVFWRTDKRFGTVASVDLERPLGPVSLARLGGRAELSEVSRGVEWSSELAALRTIGPRIAVLAAAGMDGATDSPVLVERYRLYSRVRRDVFRRWLFLELEPEIAWPWDAARRRYREYAFTVRFEVQFQGTEPPERTDVPLPPEPADPPAELAPAPAPSPAG